MVSESGTATTAPRIVSIWAIAQPTPAISRPGISTFQSSLADSRVSNRVPTTNRPNPALYSKRGFSRGSKRLTTGETNRKPTISGT